MPFCVTVDWLNNQIGFANLHLVGTPIPELSENPAQKRSTEQVFYFSRPLGQLHHVLCSHWSGDLADDLKLIRCVTR